MVDRLRGGQAAVRTLEAHGVEVVFGIPGVHTLEIYDALVDSDIRHILARHEQGAGFMADGYARASGKPGVNIIITGPGITNVATAIGEAYTDSSPVLVVSSNVERAWAGKMLGHLHDLKDQLGVMAAVTKWNARASSVPEIATLISEAFCQMRAGRPRPAHVEIPLDVLSEHGDVTVDPAKPANDAVPPREDITRAVDSIAGASRVAIYCGGGAVSSQASDALIALVERLGAPVITSVMGKGSVPEDHPMVLGNLWSRGNPVEQILQTADLLLVFGSKLGAQDTDYQRMPVPTQMIRVDIDPEEVGRNYTPTQAIVADARVTAGALAEALAMRGVTKQGWTDAQVQDVKRHALDGTWGKEQAPYLDALRTGIPRDGILVSDMTMMGYVAQPRFPVYQPRTFLFPQGYGTLGFALPAAIGAKIARPDAVVVPIVGDGGFQFTMQELATAVQFKVTLPIVIFNDSTYTAVKSAQAEEYDRRYIAVDLVNPDYLKLAEAYGIPSVRANSPEDLEKAVVSASSLDGPTIIDTPIHFEL